MFFPSSAAHTSFGPSQQEALVACITLIFLGCLVYVFSHTKPPIQRALLRLMFQPVLATTLFFTVWLSGILFSLFIIFRIK
jgi:hypothetical protein